MSETLIQAAKESEKYYPYSSNFYANRHSFWMAGQDSWTLPPAQDQDSFMQLTNIEPVLQGVLQRRRGYNLFNGSFLTGNVFTHMYSFRSEILGLRRVVASSVQGVVATDEQGNSTNNSIFTPSTGAFAPRMVLSRNYGYFADGVQADYQKWEGTTNANNLTNWGINVNSIGALIFGPNDATAAQDLGTGGTGTSAGPLNCGTSVDSGAGGIPWTNASGPGSGGTATVTLTGSAQVSNFIRFTNFGFNVPVTSPILGIVVRFQRAASIGGELFTDSLKLMRAGAPVGTEHAANIFWGNSPQGEGGGNSTDLWGTTWTPAQINDPSFGFQVQVEQDTTGSATASIFAFPTITVFYSVPTAGSWTNPNGAFTNNPSAPASASATTTPSSELLLTGFGFSVPSNRVITGIQVQLSCSASLGAVTLSTSLVKSGLPTGSRKTSTVPPGPFGPITAGGITDLWNATWLPADINATNFGLQFHITSSVGANFSIDRVQITINTLAGPITLSTNTLTTNIVLLNGRVYFYAFQNSLTGHVSSLSAPSLSTGPLTGNQVALSNIPTNTDPQVDTVLILATADGGDETTLYLLASLPNGTATYNDSTPDGLSATFTTGATLLTNALYLNTDDFGIIHGIANNNVPPLINFPIKHKGRIYGTIGQTLFFSKNLDEVTTANGLTTSKWEEAWPATNQFDISEQAETIQGLLSDGETLWIGTEKAIRRLIGDSPSNFQIPEVQFNEAGLLNQDCWKVTFYEGQPVGTLWVTPDFKVMASDFNTYQDVGTPIQDVLNGINPVAAQNVHASYVSKGPADYYMLYIPTGTNTQPDTICVFNLRSKKWFIWKPTDLVSSSLFFLDATGAPRWLFAAAQTQPAAFIYEWQSGLFQDRVGNTPVSYAVTMQSAWLDMGDYTLRKFLNQIIPTTADNLNLSIKVESASNEQDFNAPTLVVPATTVIPAPIPDDVFVPLASGPSHNRAFRFTFVSPASTIQNVLTGYSVEAGVVHRY